MSEHHFCTGRGELSDRRAKQVDKIAREYGVAFVNVKLPGEGWRYWFAGPNRGEPFDSRLARDVWKRLVGDGHTCPEGLKLKGHAGK